jgi:hypothetical protein
VAGPQGPSGDTGLTGPPGQAASVSVASFNFTFADSTAIDSSPVKTLIISCPLEFELLSCSGGVDNGSFDAAKKVAFSYNGITRVGNCLFRAFEVDEGEPTGWRIFGVATCVPK